MKCIKIIRFVIAVTTFSVKAVFASSLPLEIIVKSKLDGSIRLESVYDRVDDGGGRISVKNSFSDAEVLLTEKLLQLRVDPNVEYAEPNYCGRFSEILVHSIPDDPGYPNQWWLETVGARQAWSISTGEKITVGVIDSGIDLNHKDLVANTRADGYNFGDDVSIPQDVIGHGTFVAGLIAAKMGNGTGGAGLAPMAMILPLKISQGGAVTFTSVDLAKAIDYAVQKKVDVINLSLSVDGETQTVGRAIQRALDAGIIVVAAAGNSGGTVEFPGNYPGVISVAATDKSMAVLPSSNFGPEITISAPGSSDVYSTILGGGFGTRGQGTSYASPIISAAVSLLLSFDRRLNRERVVYLLRSGAGEVSSPNQLYGMVNVGSSLSLALPVIKSSKRSYSRGEGVEVDYRLPLTAGLVDIYVSLKTPVGEFYMGDNGALNGSPSTPAIVNYPPSAPFSGVVFGKNGFFPPLNTIDAPAGAYEWKVYLRDSSTNFNLGPVVTERFYIE